MTLQDKLNARKAQFESQAPKEAVAVMHRATEDLFQSGIMDSVLTVGAKAPHFSLHNAQGTEIDSRQQIAKGPLVLSFYRGKW